MNRTEMREILYRAKTSKFHLETLPQYLAEVEAESFAAWKAGKGFRRRVEDSPFLTRIKETTAQGAQWTRAHITPYREMRDRALRHAIAYDEYPPVNGPTTR